MTQQLSILLGSGFSVPEGLPTVTDISRKLCYLKKDDFYLTSAQKAGFYTTDYRDPNDWSSITDRKFAEDFTNFYREIVLGGNESSFNYEVFYDYMSDFLRNKGDGKRIQKMCDDFRKSLNPDEYLNDDHNLVSRFSKIFSQLVADLLVDPKYYEDVSHLNNIQYDPFFNFIRENLKDKVVNVHTLNHDIFFDHMANKHSSLWEYFTDGFTEYGSPYYGLVNVDHKGIDGIISKNYKVRLKYYNGVYDNKLRLFKLHGSIDNCILHNTKTKDKIRVKKDFGISDFLLERFDKKAKKYSYERPFAENEPDYLTGTTEKIRQYKQPFYENLFDHFMKNLLNSDQLIVVGYGFQDPGINDYLEKYFLTNKKQMIVIDIAKPNSPLFKKYENQIIFSPKGAIGNTFDDFMQWKK